MYMEPGTRKSGDTFVELVLPCFSFLVVHELNSHFLVYTANTFTYWFTQHQFHLLNHLTVLEFYFQYNEKKSFSNKCSEKCGHNFFLYYQDAIVSNLKSTE